MLAVGDSTLVTCGCVQSVIVSPLARRMATGIGGSVNVRCLVSAGNATKGIFNVEVTRSPFTSVVVWQSPRRVSPE